MAIARIIAAATFAALKPDLKAEYRENPDKAGEFILDLSDYEDPAALKRAKDHERDEANNARKALKTAQDALTALTEERDNMLKGAIPKADVERLETSYKEKLKARETELKTQIDAAQGQLRNILIDNVATGLAAEVSNSPTLLVPIIQKRLKIEKTDAGEFVTRVLDKEGKPSAMTVKELREEIVLNPDYKAIITGSKASGGGAHGGGGGGGASGGKVDWNAKPGEIAKSLSGRLISPPNSSIE